MIKIGLVGEDPNDTEAIRNLLLQKYKDVQFIPLAKRITGSNLGNVRKTKSIVEFNADNSKISLIIYIRDLDGLDDDIKGKEKINSWFKEMDFNNAGILLLNIYELEALILADIESFNKLFNVNIAFTGNPMNQVDPKGFLISKTYKSVRRYTESDAPDIFSTLKFDIVQKGCKYFNDFISVLDKKLFAI